MLSCSILVSSKVHWKSSSLVPTLPCSLISLVSLPYCWLGGHKSWLEEEFGIISLWGNSPDGLRLIPWNLLPSFPAPGNQIRPSVVSLMAFLTRLVLSFPFPRVVACPWGTSTTGSVLSPTPDDPEPSSQFSCWTRWWGRGASKPCSTPP